MTSVWRWRIAVFVVHIAAVVAIVWFVSDISEPVQSDKKWQDVPREERFADPAFQAGGRSIYKQYCAVCHGSEGLGGTGPNLVDDEWLHGSSREAVIRSIAEGYPQRGMAGWKHVIGDIEIEQVTAFILFMKK